MTGSWAGLSLSALSLGSSSQDLDPQEGHLLGILVPRASQQLPHLLQLYASGGTFH